MPFNSTLDSVYFAWKSCNEVRSDVVLSLEAQLLMCKLKNSNFYYYLAVSCRAT